MKISVPNTLHAKKEMYSPGELNFHHASQYFLKNLISVTKIRLSERKTKFIWLFPSVSIFGEAKVAIKLAKNQIYLVISEREYLRRSQSTIKRAKNQTKFGESFIKVYLCT